MLPDGLAGRKTDEAKGLMNNRMHMDSKPFYLSNKGYTTLILSSSST